MLLIVLVLIITYIGYRYYAYSYRYGTEPETDLVNTSTEPLLTEEQLIKEKEGARLLSHIKDSDYLIALAIDGKSYDSVSFADHLEKLAIGGKSSLAFVIGGSLGLHNNILCKCNQRLSFSAMTFPHQLMRLILLEQLYRSYRIQNHEPYHK